MKKNKKHSDKQCIAVEFKGGKILYFAIDFQKFIGIGFQIDQIKGGEGSFHLVFPFIVLSVGCFNTEN